MKGLTVPSIGHDRKHVFHQFTVRVSAAFGMSRDELAANLKQKGIMTGIHYPIPIHRQPFYRDLGYDVHLPVSERAAAEVLSLPVHPGLDDQDLRHIVQSLKDAADTGRRDGQADTPRTPDAKGAIGSTQPVQASASRFWPDGADVSRDVVLRGQVNIGTGTVVEDNVVLGHRDDGVLTIGENSRIRSGSIIYSDVVIGRGLKTGHNVLIREQTQIGDDVLVGTNTVVDGHCRIGNRVAMQTNVYVTAHTVVEDGVFLGPCSVTTNDKYMEYGAKLAGATIRKEARVGANSTILPGVTIGERAVIGSGAVVTRDVPDGAVMVGNPARELPRAASQKPRQKGQQ
jgi:acetyltransferase-like isoleucine patch superfamily enzyme